MRPESHRTYGCTKQVRRILIADSPPHPMRIEAHGVPRCVVPAHHLRCDAHSLRGVGHLNHDDARASYIALEIEVRDDALKPSTTNIWRQYSTPHPLQLPLRQFKYSSCRPSKKLMHRTSAAITSVQYEGHHVLKYPPPLFSL